MSAYRAESIVRLRYELELDEIERAGRSTSTRLAAENAGIAVAIAIAGVAVSLFAHLAFTPAIAGTLAVGAAVGLLWRKWIVRADRRAALARVWEERLRVEVEITDRGITFRDPMGESHSGWDVVPFWDETDEALLIYVSSQSYHVIPKRALGGDEQRATVMRIFADRVQRADRRDLAEVSVATWAPIAAYFGYLTLLLGAIVEGIGSLLR